METGGTKAGATETLRNNWQAENDSSAVYGGHRRANDRYTENDPFVNNVSTKCFVLRTYVFH